MTQLMVCSLYKNEEKRRSFLCIGRANSSGEGCYPVHLEMEMETCFTHLCIITGHGGSVAHFVGSIGY